MARPPAWRHRSTRLGDRRLSRSTPGDRRSFSDFIVHDYAYTPASLALFNHVTAAIQAVAGQIDAAVSAAKQVDGESRDALIRVGYGWLRSWCEVFTETELLQGVTQRYQPNVGMIRLPNINTDKLGEIIPKVTEVFEEACRYIDSHSQPLVTLGVSPTLAGLEQHWTDLQALKRVNDGKSGSSA